MIFFIQCARNRRVLASVVLLTGLLSIASFSFAGSGNPTLTFSPAASLVPVKQGQTVTDLITITTGGSFHGSVNLDLSGLPSAVGGWLSNDPVSISNNVGHSTLTLQPSATSTTNWFSFTLKASGDGLSVSRTYVVEVEPSAGMQVSLSLPALTIEPWGTASIKVTATPENGIRIPANASGASATVASGLPSGASAYWSKPVVSSAGAVSWTLTFATNNTVKTASDPITLSVKVTDKNSGVVYTSKPAFPLLVSLLANVNVGTTPGVRVPGNFMGLSQEWGDAQNAFGTSTTGKNTIYRQLLANLTAYGSSPINIRIGGDSTDATGEPTSTTAKAFAQLTEDTGSKFELGVNLGNNNVNLATAQAKAYLSQMPEGSLAAIEIGNEPDEYHRNGKRSSTYTVQDYYGDFNKWKENIMPVVTGNTKLMGASWAFIATLLNNFDTYESEQSNVLSAVSQHLSAASPADDPAIDYLLSSSASTVGPTSVAQAVEATHARGIPFRIGELGVISDGGITNICSSFSAALWSADVMFEFASVGVDGVNWFTSDVDPNSPFSFNINSSNNHTSYSLKTVHPLYYGLLFFQMAMGDGARMLPVSVSTEANLKAWATVPNERDPRVALINKDENKSGNVAVRMPGYNRAIVLRMTAPSYKSTTGVKLGGKTMDGSVSGYLEGATEEESVEANGETFSIPMPVTSAAMVIFTNN